MLSKSIAAVPYIEAIKNNSTGLQHDQHGDPEPQWAITLLPARPYEDGDLCEELAKEEEDGEHATSRK